MTRTIEEIASEPRVGDRINSEDGIFYVTDRTEPPYLINVEKKGEHGPTIWTLNQWRELCANAEVVGDE